MIHSNWVGKVFAGLSPAGNNGEASTQESFNRWPFIQWIDGEMSGGNKGNSLANEVVQREENRLCGLVRLTIFHLPQMIHSNIVNYLHHTIIATS